MPKLRFYFVTPPEMPETDIMTNKESGSSLS